MGPPESLAATTKGPPAASPWSFRSGCAPPLLHTPLRGARSLGGVGPPVIARGNEQGPACGEPLFVPVDLVYLCSTNSLTGVDTAALRRIRRDSADARTFREPPTARRKWTKLSDEARAEVVSRYEAGETSTALAAAYGVAKSTILGVLRANSVVVRRQPLTVEQVSEAARLYASGQSLSQVAGKLAVNQETMRVAILDAGVVLRPPTGFDPLEANDK